MKCRRNCYYFASYNTFFLMLRSSYARCHQQSWSAMFHVMASRLFGAKPDPVLTNRQSDPCQQTLAALEEQFCDFHWQKYMTKCRLQNGYNLVWSSRCWKVGIITQCRKHWIQALTCWSIRQINTLLVHAWYIYIYTYIYIYHCLLPQYNTRISVSGLVR